MDQIKTKYTTLIFHHSLALLGPLHEDKVMKRGIIIIIIISKAQILKKPSALVYKEHDGTRGSWSMYMYKKIKYIIFAWLKTSEWIRNRL